MDSTMKLARDIDAISKATGRVQALEYFFNAKEAFANEHPGLKQYFGVRIDGLEFDIDHKDAPEITALLTRLLERRRAQLAELIQAFKESA